MQQFQELDRKREVALVLINLGSLYENQKEYDKAILQFQKSYDLFKGLNSKSGMGIAISNLGSIYEYKSDKVIDGSDKS